MTPAPNIILAATARVVRTVARARAFPDTAGTMLLLAALAAPACTGEGQTVLPDGDWRSAADGRAGLDSAGDGAPQDSGPSDAEVASDLRSGDGPAADFSGSELDSGGMDGDDMAPPDADHDAGDVAPACQADEACDDEVPCTVDRCVNGACEHLILPSFVCCENDVDCQDGVACTEDLCLSHGCYNIPDSNLCCVDSGDCDDLLPCTLDRCIGNTCAHTFLKAQDCTCTSWLDCDDGPSCTQGSCKNGACVWETAAQPGCCTVDADCDDGNPLTGDTCLLSSCNHAAPVPCIDDAGCDDSDPCTSDACDLLSPCPPALCGDACGGQPCVQPVGLCTLTALEGCCHVDGECDDGIPGTVDRCADHLCLHFLTPSPKPCASDDLCDDGNACTLEKCVTGLCTYGLAPSPGCCATALACDDGTACTTDSCDSFACKHVPVAGSVVQVHWGFPQPALPPGFSVKTDGSSVKWQISGERAVSQPYSLYFGDPSGPSIDNGKKVQGDLLSDWVTLPPGGTISLTFWLFLAVEPLYSVDQLTVRVDDGTKLTPVFDKTMIGGSTGDAWKQVSISLAPFAGKKVRLELRFDSVDALNNTGEGVYVDDIDWSWPCLAW